MEVFLNGQFLSAAEAKVSVFDHGFLYGDGVYETLRTVQGKVFDAETHFERLKNSADLLQIPLQTPFSELLTATEELLRRNRFSTANEARIRWTFTRGENNYEFSGADSPTLLITAIPLPDYPAKYLETGVEVCTFETKRILPEAKTIALLPMILGKQRCHDTNTFECVFTENGFITEGTVSNFFVQFENEFWTAPHSKVLPGTAAKRFQEKMRGQGFQFQEKEFDEKSVQEADAAFLTNSLFGVLPVTKIDGHPIHNGQIPDFFAELLPTFWQ